MKAARPASAAFRCAYDTKYLARARLEKSGRRRLPKCRPSQRQRRARAIRARVLVPARIDDTSRAVRCGAAAHLSKDHSRSNETRRGAGRGSAKLAEGASRFHGSCQNNDNRRSQFPRTFHNIHCEGSGENPHRYRKSHEVALKKA
jgi:hypothetical protein